MAGTRRRAPGVFALAVLMPGPADAGHVVRYYAFSSDGRQLTLWLKSGERITQTLTGERTR